MTRISLSSHFQDESQNPTVLIDNDFYFTGYFLSQLLIQQKCRVIFPRELAKKKFRKIDYIFSLKKNNLQEIKKLSAKAEKFGARLLVAVTGDDELDRSVESFLRSSRLDWRVVILGYVYGPRMDFDRYQEIVQLIKVVKIQPVFVADAVYGLVKAMFGGGTSGKIFTLNDKTDLDWQPRVSLEEGLSRTDKFFSQKKEGTAKPKTQAKRKPRRTRKISRKKIAAVVVSICLFVLLLTFPFVSLLFHGLVGVIALQEAQEKAISVDFGQAITLAQISQDHFQLASQRTIQLSSFFNYLDQGKATVKVQKLFNLGAKVARGLTHGLRAAERGSDLMKATMTPSTSSIILGVGFKAEQEVDSVSNGVENLVAEIQDDLKAAYDEFSLIQAELESDSAVFQLGQSLGFGDSIEIAARKLPTIRELMIQAIKGTRLIPEMVGLYKKQTYLVLLQNNMELRPTGGFIGSYALLTFDQGRLLDFEVQDVYAADGQLKGHVDPPEDLRKYLGEAGWYLRDSNWDPNFPTSAVRAAWFLEKETGRRVDGVLAINLSLAQKLLKVVGEVTVPDYQEEINAANLFERAEYHSEVNFFPGSTQKKDFLGNLARSLFERMKMADPQTSIGMVKAIYESAQEKNLLIYLHDSEIMAMVVDLGWDGGVRNLQCQSSGQPTKAECLVDYLMVVESNVGVNKANYFVKRKLFRQVEIDTRGKIKETLKINYKNESQADIFPAGRYKNYIRIYVPPDSRLEKVRIYNPLTGGIEEVDEERWELSKANGKEVFGFLVEVPIREERIVEINYQLADRLSVNESAQYLAFVQKQPGVDNEEFIFQLFPPKGTVAISSNPETVSAGGSIAFQPEFDRDLVFDIKMVR